MSKLTDKSTQQEIDAKLRDFFQRTCEERGVPIDRRKNLIEGAISHFTVNELGYIQGVGPYKYFIDYLREQVGGDQDLPFDYMGNQASRREKLIKEMEELLKSGNMSQYRKVRAQYSAL